MIDDSLITFLRARESEREARALAVQDNSAPWDGQWVADENHALRTVNGHVLAHLPDGRPFKPGVLAHIVDNDPRFVLADVAAKREILDRAQELWDAHSQDWPSGDALGEYLETVLPALALLYVDHPDFRAEWNPWQSEPEKGDGHGRPDESEQ